MRKAALFSALLITLLANQLSHPEPVRGEERASLLFSEVLTGGTTAVDEYVALRRAVGFPLSCVTLSWSTSARVVSQRGAWST